MFGKEKTQAKLLGSLEDHFLKVHRAHQLPVGDFPDVTKFRNTMLGHELTKFPKLDPKQARACTCTCTCTCTCDMHMCT